MEIVTIDQIDHQVLRVPAQPVNFPLSAEDKTFALALMDKMIALGHAVGLAATQVGKPLQIFAFQIPSSALKTRKHVIATVKPTLFFNPSYTPVEEDGYIIDWEGCFSVPGYMGEVPRYQTIHYQAQLISGDKIAGIARGFLARVLQHEIGHLNGQIYKDLINDQCRFGSDDEMLPIRVAEFKKEIGD